jgi:hypothetical protein
VLGWAAQKRAWGAHTVSASVFPPRAHVMARARLRNGFLCFYHVCSTLSRWGMIGGGRRVVSVPTSSSPSIRSDAESAAFLAVRVTQTCCTLRM